MCKMPVTLSPQEEGTEERDDDTEVRERTERARELLQMRQRRDHQGQLERAQMRLAAANAAAQRFEPCLMLF
jgi:hypothetical protein